MAKFITAKEAAQLIPDECTLGVAGMGLSGWPEEVACAIRDRFAETGHPNNITLRQGSALGDWGYGNQFLGGWDRSKVKNPDLDPKSRKVRGTSRFGEAGPGLVKTWYSAYVASAYCLLDLANKNEIECYCLPQGVAVNLWREIAAGRPGLMTKVGLGTFVDPRVEGGRMNAKAQGAVSEVIEFMGDEYLFYPAFKPDVCLLRGSIADERGNISFDRESIINEGLAVAQATKACGGTVIVQVEYITKEGTLPPKSVKIPGILVDYVVQATDPAACWQAEGVYFEPAFSGQIRRPVDAIPRLALDERKVVARRCAMEVRDGYAVNLGVGMAADVANILNEEGFIDHVTTVCESGMIGGVPQPLPNFGSAFNPECTLAHGEIFDYLHSGALDMTCLGLGECDEDGNVNVSKFGPRLTGPGGFIDITSATSKVVFCGTFMGKAKLAFGDGKMQILQEGTIKKFVKNVEQISFSGKYKKPTQDVLYVTERCVFELIDGKMTIVEIAPGIDLEKDILPHMDFTPAVSPNLKLMDPGIFSETWGGLGKVFES